MKLKIYILFFILCGYNIQAQTLTPFTWQHPQYGGHALNCTRWINAQKFIAVGDAGTINLSSDDGATWQRVQPFTIVDFTIVNYAPVWSVSYDRTIVILAMAS